MAALCVPDEIVIGFFTAAIVGMASSIVMLWKHGTKKDK